MVAPLLIPILTTLATRGLDLIGSAILAKGKDVVEKELGVDIESSLATEAGTDELRVKMMEHEEKLIELALENRKLDANYFALEIQDAASARQREIAIATNENASWLNQNLVPLLALIIVGGGMITLFYTSEESLRIAVVGLMTLVLGYYFGKSSSDWKKDSTINRMAATAAKE